MPEASRFLPQLANSRPPNSRVRICAERMLTGRYGEVIGEGAVLIEGDRIVAAGPDSEVPRPADASDVRFPASTLMPGMIDAHVHVCFKAGEDIVAHPQRVSEAEAYAQALEAARLVLEAGVTTVRDLGCRGTLAQRLRDSIIGGEAAGPRILASGRPITSRQGHFWSIGIEAEGEEQVRAAVEQLIDERVDLVKVIATGGTLTPGTMIGRAQFSLQEFRALTETAHGHGRPVAAHAHGTEGILRVIDAGVDTIEHCTWTDFDGEIQLPLDDRLLQMKEQGQMIVIAGPMPHSMLEPHDFEKPVAELSADEKRVRRLTLLWRNTRHARQMGVGTALGTDSIFGQYEDGHDLAYRAQALVEVAGWNSLEVLEMLGTAGARAVRGIGQIGELAPGAYADLLVVHGDPTTRIADLHRVAAVYLGGLQVG